MNYAIMTDTSANLPTELLKKYEITAVPFLYSVDGKDGICLDTDEFNGAEYYEAIRHGAVVNTSQINPQKYMDYMRPVLQSGKDILFIGMSSGISGSYHSLCMAAQQLQQEYPERRIETVDSLGASLGEGIPVLKAAEFRKNGEEMIRNAKRIRALCHRMCQVFTVDDLIHLKRTGRLSRTAAMVGTLLQMKPLLVGDPKGKIVTCGKVRGRKKSVEALAEMHAKFCSFPETGIIGIAHADCPEDAAYLARLLKKNGACKIMTVPYEPVTGSHVGPGALALFFEANEEIRGNLAGENS